MQFIKVINWKPALAHLVCMNTDLSIACLAVIITMYKIKWTCTVYVTTSFKLCTMTQKHSCNRWMKGFDSKWLHFLAHSVYFACVNFFFISLFFFTMSKAISVSTGSIFTIFSPNGKVFAWIFLIKSSFPIPQGTLPWQPILCRKQNINHVQFLQFVHHMKAFWVQMIDLKFFFNISWDVAMTTNFMSYQTCSLGAEVFQDPLDWFSQSLYHMVGIELQMINTAFFFRYLKRCCNGNQFYGKITPPVLIALVIPKRNGISPCEYAH